MIETKLIRPSTRVMDTRCPGCGNNLKIRSNSASGVFHCIYCGADFEWEEKQKKNLNTEVAAWPTTQDFNRLVKSW